MKSTQTRPSPDRYDLAPVNELPGEWVPDFLDEHAGDVPIATWKAIYESDDTTFEFFISGVDEELVRQRRDELRVAFRSEGVDPEEYAMPTSDIDELVRGDSDARALPALLMGVDPEDESYLDRYYATLLRLFPDRILLTLQENGAPTQDRGARRISYVIDPTINNGQVIHYWAKSQTSATATVDATAGSVRLEMWRWLLSGGISVSQGLGSGLSVAGGADGTVQHNGWPNHSTYDVSVTGTSDGSQYTISGDWVQS